MDSKLLSEVVFDMTCEFMCYIKDNNIQIYDSRDLFEAIYDWSEYFEKWFESQNDLDYLEEILKFSREKIKEYISDLN